MRPRSAPSIRIPATALGAVLALQLAACRGSAPPTPPDPVLLARGEYLATTVALCETCHAERDWSFYSGPPVPGTERRGGVVGVFGSTLRAPDISHSALTGLTREELSRALRRRAWATGGSVHRDDSLTGIEALTAEDAQAVAAYLLDPAAGRSAPGEVESAGSTAARLGLSSVEAGAYLVTVGRCSACHGPDYSGGVEIDLPSGPSLPSANLTPHAITGIGRMSREEFIDFVKSLDAPELERIEVPEGERNTAMPWPWVAAITREDLGSIYDYLSTLEPIERTVGTAPKEE